MIPSLDTYDWREAFGYAGEPDTCATEYQGGPKVERSHVDNETSLALFTRADVAVIIGQSEGVKDEEAWLCAGQLTDGRWFYLEAGCDYTGWDCQASGSALVAPTKEDLIKYCITEYFRGRLGLELT